MTHGQKLIWLLTNGLLIVVVVRAIRAKLFIRYWIFYLYLSHVLIFSLVRMYIYSSKSAAYADIYWYTQFLSLAVGYCVIWEIYRQTLSDYPGTLRIGRIAVSGLFALVMLKVIIDAAYARTWSLVSSIEEVECDLRAVQIALLALLIGLVVYYSIPVGRNIRGMVQGYGFFVSTSVIDLTLRSYFRDSTWPWWRYSQPLMYMLTVCVWAVTLCSLQPNPKPQKVVQLETDYDLLAQRTAYAITKARNHIFRAVRP